MRMPLWLWRALWNLRAWRRGGLGVGETFPNFTLMDAGGRAFTLAEPFPAEWTVLWFTNLCEDCRSRIPALEELVAAQGKRFRVLAVSLLPCGEALPEAAVRAGFPMLLDPEDVVERRLGLDHPPGACPFHNLFIVDRRGRIVFRHHLSALKPETFRSLWEGLAAGRGAGPGR